MENVLGNFYWRKENDCARLEELLLIFREILFRDISGEDHDLLNVKIYRVEGKFVSTRRKDSLVAHQLQSDATGLILFT